MKHVFAALAFTVAIPVSAQTWVGLGGSDTGAGLSAGDAEAILPEVVLTSDGRPVVTWVDSRSGSPQVYLRRWTGSAWEELGGSAAGGGVSNDTILYERNWRWTALAVDSAGNPVVAWCHAVPTGQGGYEVDIYLKRWTGTRWEELGGSATDGGVTKTKDAIDPRLAVDKAGNPILLWDDFFQVYLRRWNPAKGAWEAMGASDTPDVGISNLAALNLNMTTSPWLALDAEDRPCVIWISSWPQVGFPDDYLYFRRWDGTTWADLGGSGGSKGIRGGMMMDRAQLALAPDGTPFISYIIYYTGVAGKPFGIGMIHWNAATLKWTGLGGSDAGAGIGDVYDGYSAPLGTSIAVDRDGHPWVAWDGKVGNYDVNLKTWTGSAWAERAGSASGGGISSNAADSAHVSLAVDAFGTPVVAWDDTTPGPAAIYLERCTPPPAPPLAPANAAQLKLDGITPVAAGATTNESGILASATVADINGERVALDLEIKPVGTAFDGSGLIRGAFASGVATVTKSGLAVGAGYHWRVRAVDEGGAVSLSWTCFGSDPDLASEVDFTVRANLAPAIASPGQADPATGGALPVGGLRFNTDHDGVVLSAAVSDPDAGDRVALQVEVRAEGEPFTGTPTASTALAAGTRVTLALALGDGSYRWRARSVDDHGSVSAWIDGGAFTLSPAGSEGAKKYCSAGAVSASLLVLLAGAFIRRV